MTIPTAPLGFKFYPIIVDFADAETSPTFKGYTDGRRWNGYACPWLPLNELRGVLTLFVKWGAERSFEILGEHEVRVFGNGVGEDYTMAAKLVATTDGPRWLFDCGGGWTFNEIDPAVEPRLVVACPICGQIESHEHPNEEDEEEDRRQQSRPSALAVACLVKRQAILDAAQQIAHLMDMIVAASQRDPEINDLICASYPFGQSLDEVSCQVIAWRDAMKEKA